MHAEGARVDAFNVSYPKDCFETAVFSFCEVLLAKEVARIRIDARRASPCFVRHL